MRLEQREQGEKRLAGRRHSLLEKSQLAAGARMGPLDSGAHATQGVSSPSLSQGAGRARDAGGIPGGCEVTEAGRSVSRRGLSPPPAESNRTRPSPPPSSLDVPSCNKTGNQPWAVDS